MKQMMKYAAAAGVAGLFAIGLAMPSQAAPSNEVVPASNYQMNAANMHRDYNGAGYGRFDAPGYGAYDYAPGPAPFGSGNSGCSVSPASLNYVPCLHH
jgi:hypothetical protein